MSTSLTHITFPGSFLMLLATFTVKEPLHWPSVIHSVPDEGHIRSLMSVESLWYRDQRTVMLPWEPLDRRTGSSNLAVFCVSVTLMFPSKEKTENGQKCHLTSRISLQVLAGLRSYFFLWLARMILLFVKWWDQIHLNQLNLGLQSSYNRMLCASFILNSVINLYSLIIGKTQWIWQKQ